MITLKEYINKKEEEFDEFIFENRATTQVDPILIPAEKTKSFLSHSLQELAELMEKEIKKENDHGIILVSNDEISGFVKGCKNVLENLNKFLGK